MVVFMAMSLIELWLVKSKLGIPARGFFAVQTNAQSAGATPHCGMNQGTMSSKIAATEPLIAQAADAADFAAGRILFEEYAAQLRIDLCFQGFAGELADLPAFYSPPSGCLLLAHSGGLPVGCGAIRRFSADACEMKRLYVRPSARGASLGRRLAEALAARARELGYARMLLDTLEEMTAARTLYRSLGFREIAPYHRNPSPGIVYMELGLGQP
jgi:GNAT superfamily N-acetyltransferase